MSDQKQTKKVKRGLIIEVSIIVAASFVCYILGISWWIPPVAYFGVILLMGLWAAGVLFYRKRITKKYSGWFERKKDRI